MYRGLKIFIGYDSTQEIAYRVLAYSIRKHASQAIDIQPIKRADMKARGFRRPHDPLQSTEFTYTRFLVPWLCGYEGVALFLDSDMLALGDITELFNLDMGPYALRVVKHNHRPSESTKMGGKTQTVYPRKNWSSLMILNCPRLRAWSKENVETRSGAWLHRFEPIPDAQIGEIDPGHWNVLDRHDPATKLLHYTAGGPWIRGCEGHPYGHIWNQYRRQMERCDDRSLGDGARL